MLDTIAAALIANALIVHTIRSTIGVHHPKTRSLLTQDPDARPRFSSSL
jgi:hypothetical protein